MYCVSFQVFGILSDSINLCKYIVYDVLLQEFMKLRSRHGVYTRTGTNETIKIPHMRQSGTPVVYKTRARLSHIRCSKLHV